MCFSVISWKVRILTFRLSFYLMYLRWRARLDLPTVAAQLPGVSVRDLLLIELGIKPVRLNLIPKILAIYKVDPLPVTRMMLLRRPTSGHRKIFDSNGLYII